MNQSPLSGIHHHYELCRYLSRCKGFQIPRSGVPERLSQLSGPRGHATSPMGIQAQMHADLETNSCPKFCHAGAKCLAVDMFEVSHENSAPAVARSPEPPTKILVHACDVLLAHNSEFDPPQRDLHDQERRAPISGTRRMLQVEWMTRGRRVHTGL